VVVHLKSTIIYCGQIAGAQCPVCGALYSLSPNVQVRKFAITTDDASGSDDTGRSMTGRMKGMTPETPVLEYSGHPSSMSGVRWRERAVKALQRIQEMLREKGSN